MKEKRIVQEGDGKRYLHRLPHPQEWKAALCSCLPGRKAWRLIVQGSSVGCQSNPECPLWFSGEHQSLHLEVVPS